MATEYCGHRDRDGGTREINYPPVLDPNTQGESQLSQHVKIVQGFPAKKLQQLVTMPFSKLLQIYKLL